MACSRQSSNQRRQISKWPFIQYFYPLNCFPHCCCRTGHVHTSVDGPIVQRTRFPVVCIENLHSDFNLPIEELSLGDSWEQSKRGRFMDEHMHSFFKWLIIESALSWPWSTASSEGEGRQSAERNTCHKATFIQIHTHQ